MPVPGLAPTHRDYLFRVRAANRHGEPCSGWARFSIPVPWRRAEPWALQWDDPSVAVAEGVAAGRLYAITLPLGILFVAGVAWVMFVK
jgi:hypothetical protein